MSRQVAVFRSYDMGNSETELHEKSGEFVFVLEGPFSLDPQEPNVTAYRVAAQDGHEFIAFTNELSSFMNAVDLTENPILRGFFEAVSEGMYNATRLAAIWVYLLLNGDPFTEDVGTHTRRNRREALDILRPIARGHSGISLWRAYPDEEKS